MAQLRRKLKLGCYALIIFFVLLLLYNLSDRFHVAEPRFRVSREHSGVVDEKYEYLTERFELNDSPYAMGWLSRGEVERDLDELEWLLENRYSYLELKGIDYCSALDSIRSALGDGIKRGDLVIQLRKFMSLFGDGHSGVSVSLQNMVSGYLPFRVVAAEGGLVAVSISGREWLAPQHPYLISIDGIEISEWMKAARETVSDGSDQLVETMSLNRLRYLTYLRQELSIPDLDTVAVELASKDMDSSIKLSLPVSMEFGQKQIDMNIKFKHIEELGYLSIPFMEHGKKFRSSLHNAMKKLSNTNGLIVDIRGNPGGSRMALRELFFWLVGNDIPVVVNTAIFRNGVDVDPESRWLYPYQSVKLSGIDRGQVDKFVKEFQAKWLPATDDFGPWHYMIIPEGSPAKVGAYGKSVVILMDVNNFSASDIFLASFKDCSDITLLGTPSCGGSGCRKSYRLEHSYIRINLSSMVSFRVNGCLYDGQGINPDVLVKPTPEDVAGKTDSVLDRAIELLRMQIASGAIENQQRK